MNFKEFLEIKDQFTLGGLLTEQSHPHTANLSEQSINDLPEAIKRMKDLDVSVFDVLLQALPQLEQMHSSIKATFASGHKVFICGCGSTGRLALTLETLYRQIKKKDNVISFMSGGDVAIIASVEDFEDHPEFGAQQLNELGFAHGDLLISSTEGGETPWVIGATQEASKISEPYYLYCNPDELLTVQRSQEVFKNEKIKKINLTVGHQAITGSTRMQCSTILTYAIGLGLIIEENFKEEAQKQILTVQNYLKQLDAFPFLGKFIELESQIYKQEGYIFYRSKPNVAISILTDTTERQRFNNILFHRSPTFSLYPFESIQDNPINPSWCYFVMESNVETTEEAWNTLFYGRDPRTLEGEYWQKYKHKVSLEKMLSHDISEKQIEHRISYAKGNHYQFYVQLENNELRWTIKTQQGETILNQNLPVIEDVLGQNIILKCLINIASTLVMGRMGRFRGNVMIYVRPSNFKLIDRAIRYVMYLLKQNGVPEEKYTYAQICEILFEEKQSLIYGEAIVLKVFERMKNII